MNKKLEHVIYTFIIKFMQLPTRSMGRIQQYMVPKMLKPAVKVVTNPLPEYKTPNVPRKVGGTIQVAN